jgi:hypothetical protein
VDSLSSPAFPMGDAQFLTMITVPTVFIIGVVAVTSTYYFYKTDMKGKNLLEV